MPNDVTFSLYFITHVFVWIRKQRSQEEQPYIARLANLFNDFPSPPPFLSLSPSPSPTCTIWTRSRLLRAYLSKMAESVYCFFWLYCVTTVTPFIERSERSNSGYAIKPKNSKRQSNTKMQWNTLQVSLFYSFHLRKSKVKRLIAFADFGNIYFSYKVSYIFNDRL